MKKFFDKKKMDFKFRKAGEGHRLEEEKPRPTSPQATTAPVKRSAPTASSAAAGQAALMRLEGGGRGGRAAGREDRRHSPKAASPVVRKQSEAAAEDLAVRTVDTVTGYNSVIVKLVCPICKRSIPHSDIHEHMNTCLHEEYLKEPLSASVQMIHTLCRDVSKRQSCIETICKYLDNVIGHPGEEKYRKIRVGNKTFAERVLCVDGADLFLEAVGFQQKLLQHSDGEEQFYVLPLRDGESENETESECRGCGRGDEQLPVYKELLCSSEPLKPSLDREMVLFRPSPQVNHFDLSADFFQLSVEEIRREQKLKSEDIERNQVLRTKAMRERDEIKSVVKKYRFTLLRIRLPDGLFLQAVFRPFEKLQTVREVVSGAFADGSLTYSLSAFGQPLKKDSETLAILGLVPSAVLNLSWIGAGPHSGEPYLESGLLERIQQL